MGFIASETSGTRSEREQIPEGAHIARCYGVVDIGTQEVEWQGNKKLQRKGVIFWEIPSERIEYEKDGEEVNAPRVINQKYTITLGEKGNLRRDLEAWRGKKFTAEELSGFDLQNLLGVPAYLQVVHREHNGKTYANVNGLMPLPKDMTCPPQENPTMYFTFEEDVPLAEAKIYDWLKEEAAKSIEGQEQAGNVPPVDPAEFPVEDGTRPCSAEDNLPF